MVFGIFLFVSVLSFFFLCSFIFSFEFIFLFIFQFEFVWRSSVLIILFLLSNPIGEFEM